MNDKVRNYELKFDEIKKKLNQLEQLKDETEIKNEKVYKTIEEEAEEDYNVKRRQKIKELEEKLEQERLKKESLVIEKIEDEHLEDFEPDIDDVISDQDDIDRIFEINNKEDEKTEEIKEEIDKNKEEKKNQDKKKNTKKTDKFIIILSLLIPMFVVMSVICLHSTYLFRKPFNYIIFAITIILIVLFIIKLILKIKNRGNNAKHKKLHNILFYSFMSIYIIGCIFFLVLLYGPSDRFRNWLITTAMQTMNHQYLCKWFYNTNEINYVLDNNYVLESGESTDTSLIEKEEEVITYENEYEEAILKRDKDAKYKIIELDVNGCKGYLAAIYDPSMVKLAVTQGLGRYGQYVTTMAKNNNAILAINGGGFYDPGNSSAGGTPTGITISNGQIVTNGEYGTNNQGGGIIGMTNDGVLVLLKNTTAQQAINMGVRDAVSWGPFLIVNGTPSFIKGNGGWGYAARTAIGQRKDGIVLFLTVDSNASRTNGADMVDLTEIMQTYGAINAANLDGGTSTVMVMPQETALQYNSECQDAYCYINNPIDGALRRQTRAIADAWIVAE